MRTAERAGIRYFDVSSGLLGRSSNRCGLLHPSLLRWRPGGRHRPPSTTESVPFRTESAIDIECQITSVVDAHGGGDRGGWGGGGGREGERERKRDGGGNQLLPPRAESRLQLKRLEEQPITVTLWRIKRIWENRKQKNKKKENHQCRKSTRSGKIKDLTGFFGGFGFLRPFSTFNPYPGLPDPDSPFQAPFEMSAWILRADFTATRIKSRRFSASKVIGDYFRMLWTWSYCWMDQWGHWNITTTIIKEKKPQKSPKDRYQHCLRYAKQNSRRKDQGLQNQLLPNQIKKRSLAKPRRTSPVD